MSKVADIFARLGLHVDKAEFQKGRAELGRFAQGAETSGQRVGQALAGIQKRIVGLALGVGAAMQVRDAFAFQQGLENLDIASRGSVGALEDVRSKILAVSDATGVAKDVILAGTANFVALTGDGKAASAAMETFARVTAATGSEMSDVTGASAALIQNLGIMPDQFEKAFSVLISSGKAGAIELKEMSSLFAALTPAASKFAGGAGVGGLAKISAALQLSRQGAGSAAEAATQLEALLGAVSGTAAKRLKKEGVEVFNKDGTLKEFDAIVDAIQQKDFRRDKLIEIFGRKEAVAAFESLTKVEGAWKGLTDQSLQANDLAEDYAKRQATASFKITKAWNKFKNAMTKVFTVVVKGAAFLIEHLRIIAWSLGVATVALIAWKAAAIGAAIASAASGALAILPWILLAAIFVALAFALEDLYNSFANGEGFFKQLYDAASKWLGDRLKSVILSTLELMEKIPGFGRLAEARRKAEANNARFAASENNPRRVDPKEAQLAADVLAQEDKSGALNDLTVSEVITRRIAAYNVAVRKGDFTEAAGISGHLDATGVGSVFNTVVNVTDANASADDIKRAVDEALDSSARKVEAAAGKR